MTGVGGRARTSSRPGRAARSRPRARARARSCSARAGAPPTPAPTSPGAPTRSWSWRGGWSSCGPHRPARGVSVNVGVVRGGVRPNVVPDHAEAEIDVRVPHAGRRAALEAARSARCAPTDPRSRLRSRAACTTRPWSGVRGGRRSTPRRGRWRRRWAWTLEEVATGGASEASFAAALGLPTLDGLGARRRRRPRRGRARAALVAARARRPGRGPDRESGRSRRYSAVALSVEVRSPVWVPRLAGRRPALQPARTPRRRPTLVNAATARSMWSARVGGRELDADPRLPARHHREEEALDVDPLVEQGAREALGQGRVVGREAREHDGHDGVHAGPDLEAGRRHALAEGPRVRLQPVAQLGGLGQQLQRAQGGARDHGGQAVGEEVGPAALAQQVHDLAPRRDAAAHGAAQRLAEGGGDDVHPPHHAAVLGRAAAGAAHEAGGVGVVDQHQGAVAVGQVADLARAAPRRRPWRRRRR